MKLVGRWIIASKNRGVPRLHVYGNCSEPTPPLKPKEAEALLLADRTSEALEAINEAEALTERFEQSVYCAGLHRLRAVFLAAIGAEEARIESSFRETIRIAKHQKSVSLSLEKRAEATYAEYRREKGEF